MHCVFQDSSHHYYRLLAALKEGGKVGRRGGRRGKGRSRTDGEVRERRKMSSRKGNRRMREKGIGMGLVGAEVLGKEMTIVYMNAE